MCRSKIWSAVLRSSSSRSPKVNRPGRFGVGLGRYVGIACLPWFDRRYWQPAPACQTLMPAGTEPNQQDGQLAQAIRFWLPVVLMFLFVRTVLFQPFHIPSESMEATLLVGDSLFVSKYSYGYSRYSLPFSLPLFSGRILAGPPQRGDIA